MRRLTFGVFLGPDISGFMRWVRENFQQIERATAEDAEAVIAELKVSNFTETRTLDASTATATDVANFLATLVNDVQKQGQKRAYPS